MRRKLGLMMLMGLVVGTAGTVQAETKAVNFADPPLLWAGTVLVPVRELLAATAPDATLTWDAATQTAVVARGPASLSMVLGSVTAQRDTGPETLPVAPATHHDTFYAPLRSLAGVLGLAVGYEGGAAPHLTLSSGPDSWNFPAPRQEQVRLIYAGPTLSPGFDMGVNTSEGRTDWMTDHQGFMEASYPDGQTWGAIFIVTGKVTGEMDNRETTDASGFKYLALDLKGAAGGEKVSVGIKTPTDPDNGQEPKHVAGGLTTNWQTVSIPLAGLVGNGYPKSRFGKLYVVCELVFEPGTPAETIFFRNIRFEK